MVAYHKVVEWVYKVLAEVDIPAAPIKWKTTVSMLSDLHYPDYMPQLVEKYGSENYAMLMQVLEQDGTPVKEFYHYEKQKS